MRVVLDIEANGLEDPTEIWVIVCKDIDTGEIKIFRNVTESPEAFVEFTKAITYVIGHSLLGYDLPVINHLIPTAGKNLQRLFSEGKAVDTLIVSKLVDYSRKGHSVEAYGIEFGLEKGKNHYLDFFKSWSQPLEDYCVRDVEISHKIFSLYERFISDPSWSSSIELEQSFQRIVNKLHHVGFDFNSKSALSLLDGVVRELEILDKEIKDAFPPRPILVREIHPRLTQHGTLNRGDFRWVKDGDLSEFNGGPFCRCKFGSFNPASHKQIVRTLSEAGWSPTDKTKTHVETERNLQRLRYSRERDKELDIKVLSAKMVVLRKYGYKINEENLASLPSTAPPPARLLAKRILYESRRRTLTEQLGLVQTDGRIHGKFYGIGAWTHRMAHQQPNTANIPNEFDTNGNKKLLGKELRSLWQAPTKRLLVGVDAEGIQLRIFAHYVDDPELTRSLVNGKKSDKTDPHSLNQRVLGKICKSRQAAKRFLYSLLLGGGVGKFAEILECSKEQAEEAVHIFNTRYPGFAYFKRERFPSDAKRGFFEGLDGRRVPIPGDTLRDRQHLCMSGYLQCGEAIIIKRAAVMFDPELDKLNSFLVNIIHDEYQTETPNDMRIALQVAKIEADAIAAAGEYYKLKCPMAGSYWNEDIKDYTVGTNWAHTH